VRLIVSTTSRSRVYLFERAGSEVVVHTTHRFLSRRRRDAMAVSNASVLAAVADVLRSTP